MIDTMSNPILVAPINEAVNEIMHAGFEIPMEKLLPEANLFTDLGLDSLDAVDMLVHLEDKLGVKVDGEKLLKVRTLQDIYDLVQELSG